MPRIRYRQHSQENVVGRELVHRPRTRYRANTDAWTATESHSHGEVEKHDEKETRTALGAVVHTMMKNSEQRKRYVRRRGITLKPPGKGGLIRALAPASVGDPPGEGRGVGRYEPRGPLART